MTPRPVVQRFAEEMEAKLAANDHKPDWRNFAPEYLLARLHDEMVELAKAMWDHEYGLDVDVVAEAADVANFAMMIADRYGLRMGSGR